jgi:bifunctional DNA-binding transcriptional regulator/antitoxin component of YhaV-PrlF toxin-antitoxin module
MDDNAHVMTVSRNGQVSIPAAARARWLTRRVVVVDLGDRVVVRPLSDDPVESLQGKYRDIGPDSDHVRQQEREQDRDR